MVKREDMWLENIAGTLMWKDVPLVDFEIKERRLTKVVKYRSDDKYLPMCISSSGWGLTYKGFNEMFRGRVVLDGAQDIYEYLQDCGLDRYDFEKLVKLHSGRNYIDQYWVKNIR